MFEFGVVHGRRRVGKTMLLKEAIKHEKSLYFLATQANAQTNLDIMSKVYARFKGLGSVKYETFYDLLKQLFLERNLVIVIDEFTYLSDSDKSIESVLQGLIDEHKDISNTKLIISGSEIGMFENLFSGHCPLYGRNTFTLHVKECDYKESSLYYPGFSVEDKIRAYAVFGGLPYYITQLDDQSSIKDNIINLIIDENSRFSSEVDMLLNAELRNIQEYQSVLQAIASGSTRLVEVDTKSHIHDTAKTSKYISKLESLEIVEREKRFLDIESSKKHLYRIKNNFFAFYYHYIWKNLSSRTIMDPSDFYSTLIEDSIDYYVSMRFENICMQFLKNEFKSRRNEIATNIGRYWYNDRKLKKDIEIDICVKTQENIYVYECKWTQSRLREKDMADLMSKSQILNATKCGGFSKSGFDDDMKIKEYDLIHIDEMY